MLNQYQRRSDLVPELVHAVRGAVASEQDTLVAVTSTLAGVTKIKAAVDLINNPWAFARFVAAQVRLTSCQKCELQAPMRALKWRVGMAQAGNALISTSGLLARS